MLNVIPSEISIADLSEDDLANNVKDFKSITNSMSYSKDINALLDLAPISLPERVDEISKLSTDDNQTTDFWQTMEFLEEKVDLLVDALKGQSQELRSNIMSEITQTVDATETGKISLQDGKEWFDGFLEKLPINMAK